MQISTDDHLALETLSARAPELVSRAVTWCHINSGSHNRDGLARVREALEAAFSVLPGTVERRSLSPTENVLDNGQLAQQAYEDALLITVRPEAPVQVILTGHYDTVFPANSAFQQVVTRDDGALNGPGIADMKGGISVMLAALETLELHPLKHQVGYRVLLSPDEEIGSPGSAAVLAEIGRLGHVGLTYEPALEDGALASSRKGSANFHVIVHGKSAHAGRDFASGRNAVAAAADLAVRLHALNGQREGVTLNIGAISGGGPLNVVPDTAIVRFNIRVPDQASADWSVAEVNRICRTPAFDGIHTHIHGGFTRPPKPFDPGQQALFSAIRDVGSLLGQTIHWKPSGGVCEGNNLYAVGLPNADSLGVRGGLIHSDQEFAWPDSFVERARLSALILMKLASGEIAARDIQAKLASFSSASQP